MIKNKLINADDLLNKIAERMDSRIVKWSTVEETIKKNISFAKVIDTSKYITDKEKRKLEEKSNVY